MGGIGLKVETTRRELVEERLFDAKERERGSWPMPALERGASSKCQ